MFFLISHLGQTLVDYVSIRIYIIPPSALLAGFVMSFHRWTLLVPGFHPNLHLRFPYEKRFMTETE